MSASYTQEELREFDRITAMTDSHDQVTRINGRMSVSKFVAEHGKEKCDAMWKAIQAEEKAARAKPRR